MFAELSRGDLSEVDAIAEIDKLVPATAARPLHRAVVELEPLPRDESTSETTTQREDVIPADR